MSTKEETIVKLKKQALDTALAPVMTVQEIPLSLIKDNPFQMRKKYGDIKSLADSISERGLQNPISVIQVERIGGLRDECIPRS